MIPQEGSRFTSQAVNYEMVHCAAMLVCDYFEAVDGVRPSLSVEDDSNIEKSEEKLLDEPDWTLDELRPLGTKRGLACSWYLMTSKPPVLLVVAGMDVRDVLSLTRQSVQAIVHLRSCNVTRTSALSKKEGAIRVLLYWNVTCLPRMRSYKRHNVWQMRYGLGTT